MMWLRDTLKNYMNREDILPRLKERWIQDRKLFYGNEAADLKIEEDQKILERVRESNKLIFLFKLEVLIEKEWAEIVSMTRRDNSAASQTKSNNLAKETQESGEAVPAGETTSSGGINQPLTYLEDIHIFALANLLRRPIIVLAQEFYRNIEPIRLRGIYLPLLVSAKNTVKDPILIGYHSNHFVPLMFALDDRDRERIRSSRESDKDEIPLHYNKEYFYLYNVDAVQDSTHASRDPIGFREKVNQMIKPSPNDIINDDTFKRQEHVFYNLLPLCYSDFSMMKIHFQLDDEKKKEMRLLKAYLILLSISYDFAELDRSHQSEIRDKFDHKDVLCCSLTHDSKVTLKNGVSSYLDFLNQSIKSTRSVREDDSSLWPKANRSVLGSLVNRESPIAAAGLNNYSSDNSIYAKSNSLLYNNSALKNYCKNSTCVNEGFARYNDFCLKCYERIEQERPASSNNRYVIKQEPANENVQSSRQSLNVCANLKCQAVIVSSQFRHNDSPSRYCDRCRKEKKDLEYESTNKSSYTIPVYSTNRQPSGPTEIPIKFETNRNPTRSTNAENMYSGYNRSYPMQSDTLNYDSSLNSRYRTFPVRRRVSCTYCHKEFYVDSNLPHTPNFCDQCLAYFNNR